jgi:hypothetical protein
MIHDNQNHFDIILMAELLDLPHKKRARLGSD